MQSEMMQDIIGSVAPPRSTEKREDWHRLERSTEDLERRVTVQRKHVLLCMRTGNAAIKSSSTDSDERLSELPLLLYSELIRKSAVRGRVHPGYFPSSSATLFPSPCGSQPLIPSCVALLELEVPPLCRLPSHQLLIGHLSLALAPQYSRLPEVTSCSCGW